MWAIQILLIIIGLSAGIIVAGGLFSFIISLGVVSKFATRTHTGDAILFYEDCIAFGGVLGNIIFIYHIHLPGGIILAAFWGLVVGIFVGCWAMALAEIINIFPIFIRRIKLINCVPYIIFSIALGKGVGSMIMYLNGWAK